MPPPRRTAVALLALAPLAALPACQSTQEEQGDTGLVAVYRGGTLTADLPDDTRVPAVIAAGEAVLRGRGYTIVDREATADRGFVRADPPDPWPYQRVYVRARVTRQGTRATVNVYPFGDDAASRAIMDAILVRLGH